MTIDLAAFRVAIAADWHREAERVHGPGYRRVFVENAMAPRIGADDMKRAGNATWSNAHIPRETAAPDRGVLIRTDGYVDLMQAEAGAWWALALREGERLRERAYDAMRHRACPACGWWSQHRVGCGGAYLDEPSIPEYDPGPEVDDEGGMSEYRFVDAADPA